MTKLNFIKDEWSDRVHNMSKYKMFLQQNCNSEWIQIISRSKEQSLYQKGQQIFREGDKGPIVFYSTRKVKIVSMGLNGKEQIVRLVSDGYVIGHCGIEKRCIQLLVALEDTTACFSVEWVIEKRL